MARSFRESPPAVLVWVPFILLVPLLVDNVLASNTVNISKFQSPTVCFERMRLVNDIAGTTPSSSSASELSDIADITTTLIGCTVPPTLLLSLPSSVQWISVLPPNLTLTNYSSNVSWIQPPYYPSTSTGASLQKDAVVAQGYAKLRQDCILTCAARSPSTTSLTVYLAYGQCFCGTALATQSSWKNISVVGCCVPLPTAGVANHTDASTLVPMPSECAAGNLYGLLMSVSFDCQLNASFCGSSATACTTSNGCCASNNPAGGGSTSASLEAAAAQWLVALLLIAVVFQIGYWVIKLRMCRRHPLDDTDRRANINNNNQRGRRRQIVLGGEALEIDGGGGQDDINEEMMAQLNGIAQRMRLALLRQQQRAEPRRTKDEALDAAMEALELFAVCPEDSLDPDECCPMCLDELRTQSCVRVLCSHVIHRECMKEFLAHKLVSYQAPVTCPMCRAVVLLQNSASRFRSESTAVVDMETPMMEQPIEVDAVPLEATRHPPDAPRRRPRSHSRGRRFRVAQANMAVERLLERRHDPLDQVPEEEGDMYQPPRVAAPAPLSHIESVVVDPGPTTSNQEDLTAAPAAEARTVHEQQSDATVPQEPDVPAVTRATFTVNDL